MKKKQEKKKHPDHVGDYNYKEELAEEEGQITSALRPIGSSGRHERRFSRDSADILLQTKNKQKTAATGTELCPLCCLWSSSLHMPSDPSWALFAIQAGDRVKGLTQTGLHWPSLPAQLSRGNGKACAEREWKAYLKRIYFIHPCVFCMFFFFFYTVDYLICLLCSVPSETAWY